MDINITVTEIIAESTISETVITCDVVMSMESDVDKAYVDNQLDLKVDKVDGKGLSTNDYTNEEKNSLANKVDKVANHSLVPDTEIDKLAGIEENANNYTHPEKHPASILDVVDVVNGDANKFLNERGEMVAVATSSIGVTGSQLYASTANSDVAGYKSLVETPQTLETEIILTAKSSDGIVWGDKYLSAPFTEAVTIPTTAYGFDYWRKVSAANGTSRKHLRVFLYRAGVETNISTPLASPDIDETEFTERQISYIFPELVLLAGDRIGIQEGFSTTHANNITLTYIVGDGRGWFMRLPLPLKHESLTDKNSEAAIQHVDTTTTKTTLAEADKVAILDSVTNKLVLTPKSNFGSQLLVDYTHTANKEVNVESIDFTTSVITATAHGLANGNLIVAANNFAIFVEFPYSIIPNGINLSTYYYVVNKTDNTFQLSLTSGGAAVAITDKSTKDYTKWHFEILGAVDFTNLPNLKKARIILNGKSFATETPASYFLFYKNNAILLGGTNTVWSQSGGRYGNSSANLLLIDIVSRGQCYNYHDIFIDFSLYRATLIVNGSRLYAINNTSNASVIKNNATYVHITDGNVDFDKISITSGVPNGFNIKIYSI